MVVAHQQVEPLLQRSTHPCHHRDPEPVSLVSIAQNMHPVGELLTFCEACLV